MLTGHSEKKRVTAARDAGITEFMAKPISAKALYYQRVLNVVAQNPRTVHSRPRTMSVVLNGQRQPQLCRARAAQGRRRRT